MGVAISAEAALSFLGVGLPLPTFSWGLLLAEPGERVLTTPHLLVFPTLFIGLTVAGFLLLGDALRATLDPRSR